MDTRQVLGLVLAITGVLWLFFIGRGSAEDGSIPLSGGLNSGQRLVRWLRALSDELSRRWLPGVVLLIVGAAFLVWATWFGAPDGPCCPGVVSGSVVVTVMFDRQTALRGWR